MPFATHPRTTRNPVLAATIAIAALTLTVACTEPTATLRFLPIDQFLRASLVTVEIEKALPDADVDAADVNGNASVCVKPTPSGNVLYKDDNPATPSQPCPPAFEYTGKGKAVKVPAEVWEEDANLNGIVCWKEVRPGSYVVKDDNLNTPSQPCPPAFNATTNKKATPKVPAEDIAEADDNGNGAVCLRVLDATNDFIVRDDIEGTPSQPCPPAFDVVGAIKKG